MPSSDRMFHFLAKFATKSCFLLAPWILNTCTLVTGAQVAYKCLKLSWNYLQTSVKHQQEFRVTMNNIPARKVEEFYSKTPSQPTHHRKLALLKSLEFSFPCSDVDSEDPTNEQVPTPESIHTPAPLYLTEMENLKTSEFINIQKQQMLVEEDVLKLVRQSFSPCNCTVLSKSCSWDSSIDYEEKADEAKNFVHDLLRKVFSSKKLPRQRPKSGKFWKSERCQFRKIKRDRGTKSSCSKRIKSKVNPVQSSLIFNPAATKIN